MKRLKHAVMLLLGLSMVIMASCTKPDDPNNGGNGGGSNGGGHYSGNYAYVDLGLPSGTLWATFNVGANKPEEIGDRFQWGETTPNHSGTNKYYYDGSANDDASGWTKYCWNDYYEYGYHGYSDDLRVLEPSDDAATVNWSDKWRTPTQEQWAELFENTPYTMTTHNGVYGCLFTASNGNTLFLPEFESNYYDGQYWTCNLDHQDAPSYGMSCHFWHIDSYHGDSYSVWCRDYRSHLLCVRPVMIELVR